MWKAPVGLLTLLLATASLACGGDPLDHGTRAKVVARGDSAAMALVRALGGRLNASMAAGGPVGAIEFCSTAALALTDSVSDALGPGWAIKRTSIRTRNPANAPDSMEAEALRYFHEWADSAAELQPERYVQVTPAGDYRYYMPLHLGTMCLGCHGARESLEPAVRYVLDARYPDDRATGYGQGELRGVVRVTVPRQAVR